MHGITREIKLKAVVHGADVEPMRQRTGRARGRRVLKRSDVDMKFNRALGSGNMPVGDKINVSLDISAVRQQ